MSHPMIEVNDIVEGSVVGITKFGAFIELEDGKKDSSIFRRYQINLLRM